jgi:hypothetical protein
MDCPVHLLACKHAVDFLIKLGTAVLKCEAVHTVEDLRRSIWNLRAEPESTAVEAEERRAVLRTP